MGDGFQFLDIILLAMIAAFIFLRLRGVLGKRMGHEQSPREELSAKSSKQDKDGGEDDGNQDNVVPLNDQVDIAPKSLPFDNSPKGVALREIHEIDRNFDPKAFPLQAEAAYEAIVVAFAAGDRETLKNLLSEEVYNNFEGSITDREKADHKMSTDILSINSAKIEEATLQGQEAEVTVRFETEMISQTKDQDGVVVNGDPHPHVIKELWTFARNLKSRNPNWLLITTRSAE
ncbi:MAG: Tim44 domain-containing protein [Sneathiella sp.]|nr:Tim44 domain-containing protein [Sneathiella sp.]